MSMLIEFVTNPLFLAPAAAWFLSQVVKLLLLLITHGDLKAFFSGGMPSSHTATVTGLATATALFYGTGGFEFPMTLFFAMVVIVDAMNVRWQAGLHSRMLNRYAQEHPEDPCSHELTPFSENLGHTVPEVIVGLIIGIAAGILVFLILH